MNIETLGFNRQIPKRANAQNTKRLYNQSFSNSALEVNHNINDAALSDKTSKASDRWTDVSLYTFDSLTKGYFVNEVALLRVKEQLKSECIDADKRTPTHKITDEQMG